MATHSSESSSVLFSLDELMGLEQQRVAEEKASREARLAAEAEVRARAEHAAREAERRRLDEEQARREEGARALREEAARLEAIRTAEIERARILAEREAEAERVRQSHDHERSLALVRGDAAKRRLRRLLVGSAVVTVAAMGGGAGYYFGKLAPEAKADRLARDASLAATAAAIEQTKRELDRERLERERLLEELGRVTDEKRKLELQRALDNVEDRIELGRPGGGPTQRPVPSPVEPTAPPATCGDSNDPLDGCLPGQ